jgi:hypothetical protein
VTKAWKCTYEGIGYGQTSKEAAEEWLQGVLDDIRARFNQLVGEIAEEATRSPDDDLDD